MGQITNISGEDRDVPLLDGRTIAAGETAEVDDDLIKGYAWPEETWKVETGKKAKPGVAAPDVAAAGKE